MMLDPPRLRRARAEDAATAAPLLVQALDVLALELAGVECLEAAVPLFHELFRLPGNRYSHAHAWVLDGTAGVVGVLLAAWMAARLMRDGEGEAHVAVVAEDAAGA